MREVLTTLMTVMEPIARLKAFRQAAYENLCRSHDATFELYVCGLHRQSILVVEDLVFMATNLSSTNRKLGLSQFKQLTLMTQN
jgi:hypothetical protein